MTENLTKEQLEMYKEAFEAFDKNGDGTISAKELGVVMRKFGHNPTEAELQDLIYEIDQDGNGEIDFQEFVYLIEKKVKDAETYERSLDAFRVFDKQSKGYLSLNELRNILLNVGEKLTQDEVDEMLRDLDVDENAELDYYSFLNQIFSAI